MLTDAIIAELKQKNPGESLHKLVSDDKKYVIVIKAPNIHLWRNFRNHTSDPDLRSGAFAKLIETTLVWPDHAEWDRMVAERPGLNEAFGAEIVTVAGANVKVESAKL